MSEFTPKQEAVALLLASGKSIQEASEESGAGNRTIKQWLADTSLKARVAELRSRMTDEAIGKLTAAMTAATRTLVELLGAKSETVRCGAARAILELGLRHSAIASKGQTVVINNDNRGQIFISEVRMQIVHVLRAEGARTVIALAEKLHLTQDVVFRALADDEGGWFVKDHDSWLLTEQAPSLGGA